MSVRSLTFWLVFVWSAIALAGDRTKWDSELRARRGWWSLQPVVEPAVPAVADRTWSDQPIDQFILARLEQAGLAPARTADPRTVVRRLHLVLTGIPPTSEQVDEFVEQCSEGARSGGVPCGVLEREVDRLLASPQFGERWARHWLDVVRFTESHGNEWNYEVHHAWRYRDYVIRAFNDDLPYDAFVREHIAGDLLEPRWDRTGKFNEATIGTAFYRFGEVNHDDCISLRQIGFDIADNQIDTLSKTFQATTIACARCHDHKIDAISMHDYYALLGIVRSSRLVSHTIDAPEVNTAAIEQLGELKRQMRGEIARAWRAEAQQVARYLLAAQIRIALPDAPPSDEAGLDAGRLEKWIAAINAEKKPLEDFLEPWRMLAKHVAEHPQDFATAWRKVTEKYTGEMQVRAEAESRFTTLADFRNGGYAGWQVGGHALRTPPRHAGDFVLQPNGETAVRFVLPAGSFTHSISDRLNGTLRSPILGKQAKHISFEVAGERSSALRLVSNNCQLNYKNYRALINPRLHWVTFELPDDAAAIRVYAELMTMLDNPKFPDQLATLGGDKENYRMPWDQAAGNRRSFFGITRAVLHDSSEPPPAPLDHLAALFEQAEWDEHLPVPQSMADFAQRYAGAIESAVARWSEDRASDGDARWLDALVAAELLPNHAAMSDRLQSLLTEYRRVESTLEEPRVVPGVADFGDGFDQPVFARGDYAQPGESIPRRYLEVLATSGVPFDSVGSGRLELANRLADPANPLTARVMVNRLWHHIFGAGIVKTVDDFGRVGELPSHPELLDYLASRLVADDWSIKRLIRSLVLTRTFQMANSPLPAALERDPDNRLRHHYGARRLEAEAIRDSILAVSGRLDRAMYGMSVHPYREKDNADRRLFAGPLDGRGRRSLYIKNNLMESPHFLSAFDFPGGKVTQGRRDVTNVPAQALTLINDPFVLEQASVWADRLVSRDDTTAARIEFLFRACLNRGPTDEERERFLHGAARLAALHAVPPDELLSSHTVWKDLAHAMFNLKEFIYIP